MGIATGPYMGPIWATTCKYIVPLWYAIEGYRRETGLSPPVKYFTDRSKVVLLFWIFYVLVLSCVCFVFVRVCLCVLCGHLLGKG